MVNLYLLNFLFILVVPQNGGFFRFFFDQMKFKPKSLQSYMKTITSGSIKIVFLFCSILALLSRQSDGGTTYFWTNAHPLGSCPFPSFPVDSLISSQLILLLGRSQQAEIIIVKHLIQDATTYATRVRIDPRLCDYDHGRRKHGASTLSARLSTNSHNQLFFWQLILISCRTPFFYKNTRLILLKI